MHKSKLALLGPYPPPYGGISTFMQNLYRLLLLHKLEFKFLVVRSSQSSDENLIHISQGLSGLATLFMELADVKISFDCTEFCLEYPSWKRAYLWLLIKRIHSFKWIKMIHDGSLPTRYTTFSALERKIFRNTLNHIDELVVVNHELATWVRKTFDYKRPISVVGSLLPSSPDEQPQLLEPGLLRFLGAHEKIVCSIGIFSKVYGFDDVVHVIEGLRDESDKRIGLVLIDAAFFTEPSFKESVLAGRDWVFIVAAIPVSMVREILKRSDVFVRATKYESYGLSRVEAILCQKLVIATDVGETRGMLIYQFGDRQRLAKLLRKALFTSRKTEADYWREFYLQQAHENWSKLQEILDN